MSAYILKYSEVDFADIKSNLKTYLQSQTQFNDYDFGGSNMSVLMDVLSYNTHYNAFYTNMLANEMFLNDTAQQKNGVVSRTKELGYITRSARGASANVTITFTGVSNAISEFALPKDTTFTTSINNRTFTFVTPETNIIKNIITFSKAITITEGTPVTQEFTVNDASPVKYIIPNENVDTKSIRVTVKNPQVLLRILYTHKRQIYVK